MKTNPSLRPVLVYLGTAFGIAVAVALALPHMGIATLLSALIPVTAVAITIPLVTAKGGRRAAWAAIGWRRPPVKSLAWALFLPALVATFSFGMACVFGVLRVRELNISAISALEFVGALVAGTVLFLGEEVGWRGFLYPHLSTILPKKRAALLTGAIHATFHLPLLLLTTTYDTAGKRAIVVPMLMVTIGSAGVIYAWIREISGSVWPVAAVHNAVNVFMGMGVSATVGGAAARVAYVTTETGVLTLVAVVALAGWLLVRPWARASHVIQATAASPADVAATRACEGEQIADALAANRRRASVAS